jgi:hypothetical protein
MSVTWCRPLVSVSGDPARAARERAATVLTQAPATRLRCSRRLIARTRLNAALSANGVL